VRKLAWALAVLVLLVAGGAYVALNSIDVIVAAALEHWGPDVVGAPVSVDKVQISARDGRGSIRGLEVGAPPGFTARRTARFGEIRVALDPSTLGGKVVVIHEIVIDQPTIVYERGDKATNLDAIRSRIDAYAKRANAAEARKQPGPAVDVRVRFVIERLEIRGGKVVMTDAALEGQGLTFDLPPIELRDVGKGRGGVSASEAAGLVASVLQVKIAQKVLTNMDLLRKGGVEGAVDALKGLLK
jgi:uncharacterized protein involved in outer membrane biogenesis